MSGLGKCPWRNGLIKDSVHKRRELLRRRGPAASHKWSGSIALTRPDWRVPLGGNVLRTPPTVPGPASKRELRWNGQGMEWRDAGMDGSMDGWMWVDRWVGHFVFLRLTKNNKDGLIAAIDGWIVAVLEAVGLEVQLEKFELTMMRGHEQLWKKEQKCLQQKHSPHILTRKRSWSDNNSKFVLISDEKSKDDNR